MGLWNGLRKLKFKIPPSAPSALSAPFVVNPYFLRNTYYFLVTPLQRRRRPRRHP